MNLRRLVAVALVAGTCDGALAQPQTQGSVTWRIQCWIATPGALGWANGSVGQLFPFPIRPGEGLLVRMYFDLEGTPGGWDPGSGALLGSPRTYSSTIIPGSAGAGGLGGLWNGVVDVVVSGPGATGTWSDNTGAYSYALRRRLIGSYNAGGGAGLALPDRVTNVMPAQFGANADLLDHGDNVTVWTGLWIPDSYEPRTVTVAPILGSLGFLSSVYALDNNYEIGVQLPIPLQVPTHFAPGVQVQIVPSPGAAAAVMGLGFVLLRRRRPC
jgi:hypothetical protein